MKQETQDRYIVTLYDFNGDYTQHSEYGRAGMIEGIQTVSWTISKSYCKSGSVHRVTGGGFISREVFYRGPIMDDPNSRSDVESATRNQLIRWLEREDRNGEFHSLPKSDLEWLVWEHFTLGESVGVFGNISR